MFKKLFAIAIVFQALAAPVAVLAQTVPEFNPVCWKEKQCLQARAQIVNRVDYDSLSEPDKEFIKDGFAAGKDGCVGGDGDERWGKCLPGGVAKTIIAFGGKRQFTDIGDFIQSNYSYILSLASILAVIMIVVAGFQWVTSGGNSEAISSAKNRIGGAVIGLFIAYTSYFILNTINPYLVNLQLPQTWLVRPQTLTSQFCYQAPPKATFAFAAEYTDQLASPPKPASNIKYDLSMADISKNTFYCGHRFYIKDGGSTTCYGNVCGKNASCVRLSENERKRLGKPNEIYACKSGQMFLHFEVTDVAENITRSLAGDWGGSFDSADWLDDAYLLYGVCKSSGGQVTVGSYKQWNVDRNVITGNLNQYDIILGSLGDNQGQWGCPSDSPLVGFFFTNEMGVNWNPLKDGRFVVGYKGGNAVVGVWNKQVTMQDYFPLEQLTKTGISVNVGFTAQIIKEIIDNKGSEPTN